MPEKISIMKDSGETLSSNIVSIFTIPDTGKNYIITTENAVDPHGLTVLHVSEIVDGVLNKIATDEEWSSIKTIMRSIISGSVGSYKFLPVMTTVKAVSQYSRDISVSSTASKQIIDSYNAADKVPMGSSNDADVLQDTIEDVMEITPGISEVSAPAPAPAPTPAPAPAPEAVQPVSKPPSPNMKEVSSAAMMSAIKPIGDPTAKKAEKKAEGEAPAAKAPTTKSAPAPAPAPAQEKVVVHEPVVAYVDPAFQQLLTADYNQFLMHIQGIQNMINQIAMMPALNYQPSYSTNPNGTPNFNPNATVDEIIMGSTEVFNEGVKNLVATITEKLYRDLYEKENALKQREEMLLQREAMLNNQMATIVSNFGGQQFAPQQGVPVQPMMQQVQTQMMQTPQVVGTQQSTLSAPASEATPAEVAINVVNAPVQVDSSGESAIQASQPQVVEATPVVVAQQNTAPVAEPAANENAAGQVDATQSNANGDVAVATPIANNVPQPVHSVEII